MYYVICPHCESNVEVGDQAVGPERSDPWNVVACPDCGLSFDFDDEEVFMQPDSPHEESQP